MSRCAWTPYLGVDERHCTMLAYSGCICQVASGLVMQSFHVLGGGCHRDRVSVCGMRETLACKPIIYADAAAWGR
jgi:hypothetical protein